MALSRRSILALGGTAVGFSALTGGAVALWPRAALQFDEITKPAGFRRLKSQGTSAGSFATGVEVSNGTPVPLNMRQLCETAFQGHPMGAGQVVIAAFSDFFCPYCRVLDQLVHGLVADDPDIILITHQVPLLGRASQMAARGAIAAQRQSAYEAFFARLIRTTFVPNTAYLKDIAQTNGLDVAQFEADLFSPQTDATLETSAAAFRAFGFVGTPGLAVGRSLVNGVIAPRDLRALIKVEKAEDGPSACKS